MTQQISINDFVAGDDLNINTGNGKAKVKLKDVVVADDLRFDGGQDDDDLKLDNVTVEATDGFISTFIDTFGGKDKVEIKDSSMQVAKIRLGDDDDKLKLKDSIFASLDAGGGLGDDELKDDNNTYLSPPVFTNFE